MDSEDDSRGGKPGMYLDDDSMDRPRGWRTPDGFTGKGLVIKPKSSKDSKVTLVHNPRGDQPPREDPREESMDRTDYGRGPPPKSKDSKQGMPYGKIPLIPQKKGSKDSKPDMVYGKIPIIEPREKGPKDFRRDSKGKDDKGPREKRHGSRDRKEEPDTTTSTSTSTSTTSTSTTTTAEPDTTRAGARGYNVPQEKGQDTTAPPPPETASSTEGEVPREKGQDTTAW